MKTDAEKQLLRKMLLTTYHRKTIENILCMMFKGFALFA